MNDEGAVAEYYGNGTIWERLMAALADDGADVESPTLAELAPYDQFHGRGLEATIELADGVEVAADDHLFDVGSGLGGPARVLADRFGCRVTGIDLTAEFCDVAQRLNDLTGLADRVRIHHGSALKAPFEDGAFDGAYSMNVSMNIADREALYREIHRVLRPGGWLVLSEVAQGPDGEHDFPVPWARTAAESFLLTPDETCDLLAACGFTVDECADSTEASRAYRLRARALVAQGHKPPVRSVGLVHPDVGDAAMANSGAAIAAQQITPIEVRCRRT